MPIQRLLGACPSIVLNFSTWHSRFWIMIVGMRQSYTASLQGDFAGRGIWNEQQTILTFAVLISRKGPCIAIAPTPVLAAG